MFSPALCDSFRGEEGSLPVRYRGQMIVDNGIRRWREAALGLFFVVLILFAIWLVSGFWSLVCIAAGSAYTWVVLFLFMRLYKFHPLAARLLALFLFVPLAIIPKKYLWTGGKEIVINKFSTYRPRGGFFRGRMNKIAIRFTTPRMAHRRKAIR